MLTLCGVMRKIEMQMMLDQEGTIVDRGERGVWVWSPSAMVCESQQSCLFVGDQILIFHHNLQINSLKILQCDFPFFFLFVS